MWRAALSLCLAVAATAAAAKTYVWEEDVTVHDGRTIALTRTVERGDGRASLPGSGSLRRQSIAVHLTSRTVVWRDDLEHPYVMPVAFEMAGDDPVVVIPVYGWFACRHYDFPPEGLAALRYREGRWTRMPLSELPEGMRKNLLPSPESIESSRWKGQRIDAAARRELDYGLGAPGNPVDIAGLSRLYAGYGEACRRMRPPPDPVADAARERIAAAERTAREVRSTLVEDSREALPVSPAEYRRVRGNAGVRDECRGILDGVETVSWYTGDANNMRGSLTGYRVRLADQERKPGRIDFANSSAPIQTLTCDAGIVYVVRRLDATRLVLHRFRDDGTLVDAFRIAMPGAERMGGGRRWGGLWEIVPRAGGVDLVLADYSYPQLANLGGTITHRQVHRVDLPVAR